MIVYSWSFVNGKCLHGRIGVEPYETGGGECCVK